MSDVMLFGVLRMPYELAMSSELLRRQFWDRAQEAADRLAAAESRAEAAEAERDALREVLGRISKVRPDRLDHSMDVLIVERCAMVAGQALKRPALNKGA